MHCYVRLTTPVSRENPCFRTVQVRVETLKRGTPEQTLREIPQEAEHWNVRNPWAGSLHVRDRLRARAGTWKAYGADKTVLSWIICGARLPHIWKPHALQFPNHKSAEQNAEFVSQEIDAAVADGTFRVVERADVRVINPISVAHNANGDKLRLCFDARAGRTPTRQRSTSRSHRSSAIWRTRWHKTMR